MLKRLRIKGGFFFSAFVILIFCWPHFVRASDEEVSEVYQITYFDAKKIEKAIQEYEKIKEQGGWGKVDWIRKLEKGASDKRVAQTRQRLQVTGELKNKSVKNPEFFDDGLEAAVKIFQTRHGLNADGVIGAETLRELNASVEERLHQLNLSLQRLEFIPAQDLGERFILVNIPAFYLDMIEKDQSIINMRVIVGLNNIKHRTPLFSQEMKFLVLNPVWHVPESIATKELLPKIKEDPTYFKRNNYKVISTDETNPGDVDPDTIDWSQVDPTHFNYLLKQKSGHGNSLGKIKFMFPNQYNVYLHDTPARSLFKNNIRSFSHGCVRIQKPMSLAKYLLQDQPEWTEEKINSMINSPGEKFVNLKESIPVHLIYYTAWVDHKEVVQFRRDIYGYDKNKFTFSNRKFLKPKEKAVTEGP